MDDTPPVTTKEIGNPQSGGGLYVTTSTPIWLNTTDETVPCAVGCEYLHFEVWWDSDGDGTVDVLVEGGNASSNNVTIYFTEECYHELRWYGVDSFGNTEALHVQSHYVDDTPPTTTKTYGTPYSEGTTILWSTTDWNGTSNHYINSSTPVTLATVDYPVLCASGVYRIQYCVYWWNEASSAWIQTIPVSGWKKYTNPFTLDTNEGLHRIRIRSYDKLGNMETAWDQYVMVDNTPPVTTKEYGSPFCIGDTVAWPVGGDVNHYITKDTLIYLNATDNYLGINRTEYLVHRWNGSAFIVVQPWTMYLGPFSFASIGDTNECLHRIRVRSYDILGNAESAWSQYVMVDNTPPVTTKEIGSPQRSGGLYVTTDTPIWLNTTDTGVTRCRVGCNYTHYEVWWDSDGDHDVDLLMESDNASSNNVTLYFTEACYHEIWWYGVDFLGNTESMHVWGHYVDDAAPDITMQMGYPRYNYSGDVYVTTGTPFWINVTDDCNLSHARVWYQNDSDCDDIYTNEYLGYYDDTDDDDVISLVLYFPQEGCHRWRVQAFDMYGRETGNWYSDWYSVIGTTPKISITGTPNQLGHEEIPVTFTAGTVTASITVNATITILLTGPELDDNLTYYWDWNNDGIYEEGPFTTSTADHTWPDDYTENVNVQVQYKYGGMDTDTCLITILNVKPTTPTDLHVAPAPYSLGNLLEATASGSTDAPFDDEDAPNPLTYWYLFYDATTNSTIQDWSMDNSIVITEELEDHVILIKSRAQDKDMGISDIISNITLVDISSPSPCACRKGDYNKDCVIDFMDLLAFAQAYGSALGDPNYHESMDFDDDGLINFLDFIEFAHVWGQTYCPCGSCNAPLWQQWP